ncbi:hypothetical protein V8C40DRAFT_262340 [Trichoderma camerunense]
MAPNVSHTSRQWDVVDVKWICFTQPSMRTSDIDIRFSIGPEFDIGWISSLTASIYYGDTLIGKITQEDEFVLSDELDDTYDIVLKDFEIQDMIAFRTLIQNTMPNTRDKCQPADKCPTAFLQITEKGHKLEMRINLDGTGSLETSTPMVRKFDDSIVINFLISNHPHMEFIFGKTTFMLEKDGEFLAFLDSHLHIQANDGGPLNYSFKGKLPSEDKLCGKAKLRGCSVKGEEKTWFIHAIREFELEVDLDQVVVCEDESDE